MINKVKNALKVKLENLYPNYNIYLEDKPISEIVKPALRIIVEEKTAYNQRDIINQNVQLDIASYLDDANKNEKYWDISDKLDEELGYLEIENTLIRIGERISEITEDTLHYRFSIQLKILKPKDAVDSIKGINKNVEFK
ncbi:phage tail terminator family protein [Vallitalea guaymasensis]|uniref:Uncharacterized protein n=1 Tax=Vallitalea guaymasensis TaxID=1185412 RepID=A0A8J8MAZ0_9FIRM|nr:hypothetical protein [Vallitalea guaymasensis]QUH29641.1 hypothetical protein HYG85_12280 [Vallitalea guaymasensis]